MSTSCENTDSQNNLKTWHTIDDGFINRHGDDPISKTVSAELQKFFIAWKENNYQSKPIPDATALILTVPAQAAPASATTRAQNPFALMPQPQARAQGSQPHELSPAPVVPAFLQ